MADGCQAQVYRSRRERKPFNVPKPQVGKTSKVVRSASHEPTLFRGRRRRLSRQAFPSPPTLVGTVEEVLGLRWLYVTAAISSRGLDPQLAGQPTSNSYLVGTMER